MPVSAWDNLGVLRKLSWLGLVVLPVVFGWLGDVYATRIWQPVLLGHSCPANSASCFYHPLLVAGVTWTALGALIGLWAAAVLMWARRQRRPRRFHLTELIVVTPLVVAVLWWGHRFGMQQGGTWSDFGRFATVLLGAAVVRVAAVIFTRRTHGQAPLETGSVAAAG